MRKSFLMIRGLNLLSFPWENIIFLETFSLAIFMDNSSLRLSEVHFVIPAHTRIQKVLPDGV